MQKITAHKIYLLPAALLFAALTILLPKQIMAQQLTDELLSAYVAKKKLHLAKAEKETQILFDVNNWSSQSLSDSLNSRKLAAWIRNNFSPTKEKIKFAAKERQCLAKAIYHEARGEPEEGQWAVANIILNRVASPYYPSTICGVVYQNANGKKFSCQFTFACDGKSDDGGIGNRIVRVSWVRSNLIAHAAYREFIKGNRPDILPDSALFYHTKAVSPNWAQVYKIVATIGNHIFYEKS